MKTIVITSGYFNPIHPGHIECLEMCKELGNELRVIVNNDKQVIDKTGKLEVFQDQDFRIRIVSALKVVDQVVLSIDKDGSVCESIRYISNLIRKKHGESVKIIFGKGGDRFANNIPEVQLCKDLNIQIKDGLGAKIHNSSTYRAKS